MSQYTFGAGALYGVKTGSGTNTPIKFGGLQGVSLDFAFSVKELYGAYQFPIAVGRGVAKVSGRANFAQLNGQVFNDLFLNSTTAMQSTQLNLVDGEAGTIATGAVTVANNPITQDLGVVYAATGLPFTKVASAPSPGQYSVNLTTGVYTFNTGENGAAVLISYQYQNPAKAITSSSVANPTVITATAHGLGAVGDTVRVVIAGHTGSTPSINGEWLATVTAANTFTIPVNVTVGGTGGTVTKTGRLLTLTNALLGTAPAFAVSLKTSFNNKSVVMTLNQCMSSKLAFQTRLEDFMIPDFDFSCFVDESGSLGYMSFAE